MTADEFLKDMNQVSHDERLGELTDSEMLLCSIVIKVFNLNIEILKQLEKMNEQILRND